MDMEINGKKILLRHEYNFLRNNSHLGQNVILLGISGSHGYGTNTEGSDLDVRGVSLRNKTEILLGHGFDQVCDSATDTVVYSFNKFVDLLKNCNPNVIEMLGLKPEHYIYKTDIGQTLIDNRHMFLSKRAIHSFGGYAHQQMRRLENKSARTLSQIEQEENLMKTIQLATDSFKYRYTSFEDDSIKLYLDDAIQEDFEKEIFMDIHLTHYPLRDYKCMWSEMNNIVKDYGKVGKRNKHAARHDKLGKHMMHLIRLYLMCIDILELEEIITYREKEHDFLMEIRNGKYLDDENRVKPEFFDIVDDLKNKLDKAAEKTALPDYVDNDKINRYVADINELVVKGEI